MKLRVLVALLALTATPLPASGGEVPGALIQLETFTPFRPDQWAEAAPVRFALLPDGSLFVGGTSVVFEGTLDKEEIKELERLAEQVRRMKGLAPEVSFDGEAVARYRLRLGGRKPLQVSARGNPEKAPAALRPLAALVSRLESFLHPSLQFHRAKAFLVRGREYVLLGGCKPWALPLPFEQVLGAGALATWDQARDWPHGANPASVCEGDKRYAVWFKPLLPGEVP